jgi:hypothetical protein
MSSIQIIVIALALVIVLYFLFRPASGSGTTTPARLKIGMVHLVPGADGCCEAAKHQTTARYKAASAPSLPLPECHMPLKCKCTMKPMGERRSGLDRRSGNDKRDSIRFEDTTPRRKIRGRRPGDHDVFQNSGDD